MRALSWGGSSLRQLTFHTNLEWGYSFTDATVSEHSAYTIDSTIMLSGLFSIAISSDPVKSMEKLNSINILVSTYT